METIYGIGIDIVETRRVEASIRDYGERFLDRLFTPGERSYCESMHYAARHFAARFAAKEAIAKAFGTGIGTDLAWRDMEILRDGLGCPHVALSGRGALFAERTGIVEVKISLSHAEDYAAAHALALSRAD